MSGGINDRGELSGKIERTATDEQWMRACDEACRELFGVDIHWFCSSDEGDMLCSTLLGYTRARNTIHDYFWSLMFDEVEEEEVARPHRQSGGPCSLTLSARRRKSGSAQPPPTRRELRTASPAPFPGLGKGKGRGRQPMPPPQGKGKGNGKGKAKVEQEHVSPGGHRTRSPATPLPFQGDPLRRSSRSRQRRVPLPPCPHLARCRSRPCLTSIDSSWRG